MYQVFAGSDPTFTPSSMTAEIGDTIIVQFTSGNHSLTESTFEYPCVKIPGGLDSGYMANVNDDIVPTPQYSFDISQNTSQCALLSRPRLHPATNAIPGFYSKQKGECGNGMTLAINPDVQRTAALFQQNAISQNGTSDTSSSGTSTGVKVGASIAAVVGFILTLGLFLFFFRRRRQHARDAAQNGSRHADLAATKMQGSSCTVTEDGSPRSTGSRPVVPPKGRGEEVHGCSRPSELGCPGGVYEPVEMLQPPVEIYTPDTHATSTPTEPARNPIMKL